MAANELIFLKGLFWFTSSVPLLVVDGCAPATNLLLLLNLGMSQQQVISAIGETDVARGSIRNKYDQITEVWELSAKETRLLQFKDTILVFFHNNNLVQWGEAREWGCEADKIYEYRFR
ncbi:MAG: hypothetical protein Q8N03_15935 [Ignavibacteria bacterium]|nr:hypothetical protein [Ignavibacteria bacterium]